MDKIDFKISLLLAPLAYAIHHIEEHIIFNFRAWRLIYFPDNNPMRTEAVLSIIMAVTLFYIIYHQIASTRASAEGVLFFLMATQVHNVIYHVGGSLLTLSYSPGTLTAIVLYIPANIFILKKAYQEEIISNKSCLLLFICGGLTFWFLEFFGILFFLIGVISSWIWIIIKPLDKLEKQ